LDIKFWRKIKLLHFPQLDNCQILGKKEENKGQGKKVNSQKK
jgi:hypothetical protein